MLNVIFPEQTISNFMQHPNFGVYGQSITPPIFTLSEGSTYTVVWDGNTYECVAVNTGAVMPNSVSIGNLSMFGYGGNNEPFIILYMPEVNTGDASYAEQNMFASLTDTESTPHTITVYEGVYEPPIILKDKNGNAVNYEGVQKVALKNANGETVIFSKTESAIFVEGEIKGITSSSNPVTVAHNMGVIPDIICLNVYRSSNDTSCMLMRLNQCSSAMFEKYGVTEGNPEINVSYGITVNHSYLGDVLNVAYEGYDEGNTVSNANLWGFIRDVNATHFTFGGGSVAPLRTTDDPEEVCYSWYAITGLSG